MRKRISLLLLAFSIFENSMEVSNLEKLLYAAVFCTEYENEAQRLFVTQVKMINTVMLTVKHS